MNELSVEYVEFEHLIESFSASFYKIVEELKCISEYIQNLDIFWDGTSNSEFIARVNEDLAVIEGVVMRAKELLENLYRAMEAYQVVEKSVIECVGGV